MIEWYDVEGSALSRASGLDLKGLEKPGDGANYCNMRVI